MLSLSSFLKKYSGIIIYKDLELKELEKKLENLKLQVKNKKIEKNQIKKIISIVEEKEIFYLKDICNEILKIKRTIYINNIIDLKSRNRHLLNLNINDLEANMIKIKNIMREIFKDTVKYNILLEIYNDFDKELKKQKDNKKTLFSKYIKNDNFVLNKEEKFENIDINYNEIVKNERLLLKKTYREAAKLCHPDIIKEENKSKATDIMKTLNEAYSREDLNTIKEILISLETGFEFEIKKYQIKNKEIIKIKIAEYKNILENIKNEIEELKNQNTIDIYNKYPNLDKYFSELAKKFILEKDRIELELKSNS